MNDKLFGYCPDCGVSRIPPFLNRCSRCCDTEIKQIEQASICEMNKLFYGDDGSSEKESFVTKWAGRLSCAWDALRGRLNHDC